MKPCYLSIFIGTQPSIGSTFQTRHFLRHFFLSSIPPQKQCPFQCWIDFIVPTPNGHYLVVGPLSISSLSYSYKSRLSPFFFGPYACKSMAKRYETSKRPTEVERNGKGELNDGGATKKRDTHPPRKAHHQRRLLERRRCCCYTLYLRWPSEHRDQWLWISKHNILIPSNNFQINFNNNYFPKTGH